MHCLHYSIPRGHKPNRRLKAFSMVQKSTQSAASALTLRKILTLSSRWLDILLPIRVLFVAWLLSVHEIVSHLGNTHIVLEGPVVAMNRQLPTEHPIFALLHPHLEGTALINWGAQNVRASSSLRNASATFPLGGPGPDGYDIECIVRFAPLAPLLVHFGPRSCFRRLWKRWLGRRAIMIGFNRLVMFIESHFPLSPS